MWYSFVRRTEKGLVRTELAVDDRIRDYARSVGPLVCRIIQCLRQDRGVANVASALPVLTERAELLRVRMVGDLWAVIPRIFLGHAANAGYLGSRLERLIDQIRSMRNEIPYDGLWHGYPDAERWQIPHVWPGKYAWPLEHPRTGERLLVDPVSGVEFRDGHIVRIWPTAPLAHYVWDRLVIPLDVVLAESVKCLAYRRHGETLAFLTQPERVDETRDAVERVMAVYALDYSITTEQY